MSKTTVVTISFPESLMEQMRAIVARGKETREPALPVSLTELAIRACWAYIKTLPPVEPVYTGSALPDEAFADPLEARVVPFPEGSYPNKIIPKFVRRDE